MSECGPRCLMGAALLLFALLVFLRVRPCPCRGDPVSSPAVTARLAAKWPATPLLLEARCVQPPPPSSGEESGNCCLGRGEAGGSPFSLLLELGKLLAFFSCNVPLAPFPLPSVYFLSLFCH